MGRHARPEGRWFDPRGWLIAAGTALFVFLVLRQIPCLQTEAHDAPNAIIRLCYSDIPPMWMGSGLSLGASPLVGHDVMQYPPVLSVMLLLTVALTRLFGGEVGPDVEFQAQLDAGIVFFAVTTVWLFVCFLLWILAHLFIDRGWRGPHGTWTPLWVAASPVVLASGLISWELLPIALTALSLLLLSRRRIVEAGALLGLAMAAGSMPFLVMLAVIASLVLRRRVADAVALFVSLVVAFLLVHLPLLATNPGSVLVYYRDQLTGETSYGSLWYLLEQAGVPLRETGALGVLILTVFIAVVIVAAYLGERMPRAGSLTAIFLFAAMVLAPAYPPQMGLWLLLALVLSRPYKAELTAFTIVQVAYWAAVWGWISGHLTAAQNGPQNLYFAALLVRVVVDIWIITGSLRDAWGPLKCPILDVMPTGEPASAEDDSIETGGRHAASDGHLVADRDERVGAGDEQH